MKTCLIEIMVGDLIQEKNNGRVGILKSIKVTPNGINDPRLVTLLYVYIKSQNKLVCSTSDNWMPVEDENIEEYLEFYPSVHLGHLSDKIAERELV